MLKQMNEYFVEQLKQFLLTYFVYNKEIAKTNMDNLDFSKQKKKSLTLLHCNK